jgi:hypothetical protein
MEIKPADVDNLTRDITWEILGAFSLPRTDFWQDTLGKLFYKPARIFSEIFAKFDQDVAEHGLSEACRRLLPHFVEDTQAVGADLLPKEGPVLIASNHPGIVDGVSIIANSTRDDAKVVVGGMPFLQSLPVARHSTIASSRTNDIVRANVVKSSIRHLENGGAVLIFPSGHIDPDPAVLPGALDAVNDWSKSLAIMLRRVPETRFVPVVTSGVLHEKYTNTPLTFLKRDGVGKRRIMEFIQVMRQLIFKEKLGLVPLITFDHAVDLRDLNLTARSDADLILQSLIERGKILMEKHLRILSEKRPPVD